MSPHVRFLALVTWSASSASCVCFLPSLQDPAQFISAKVENIVSYGAFFGLDDGCSGFVHISQVHTSVP